MALNGNRPSGPILIGFADALAAPEAAASLLAAGLPVAAFQRHGGRSPLRRRPDVSLHAIVGPEREAAAALAELTELAARIGAVALMPLDDMSLWLCDRAARETGLPVVGPSRRQAELALDKARQVDAASQAGLPVPPTQVFATASELEVNDFPVMVKPALAVAEADGKLVRGTPRVCADAGELRSVAREAEGSGPVLVQPLLSGTGEGLFGIAIDGEILHPSAHRRVRMVNPQGSGSSACASAPADPELVRAGARMLGEAGWRGLFMLEFLRDRHGAAWFMELNGRSWGSLALARRLGLEYPAWAALDALGIGSVPAESRSGPRPAPVVCRHLGRELLHVGSVMRGPRSSASADWPSRWRTVRDVARVRRGERWYNWSSSHPTVFVADTVDTVLGALRERAGR